MEEDNVNILGTQDSIVEDNNYNVNHREKFIITLLSLLILFFCTFTFALIAVKGGHALFNIGIGYLAEGWLIVLLSFVFIIKVLYELKQV